ncbi:putative phosphate ABC transporter, permease protein [metagenome]|uniref:Putative phosphate ABC transporter, permease protein n=1 Tax=metagenome TaxID=256318 RepID=A0A2P2C071_9ZZZZ
MSVDLTTNPDFSDSLPLSQPQLPTWAPVLVGVVSLAASGLLAMLLGWGLVAVAIVAVLIFLVALPAWALAVENRRSAVDRLVTTLIWTAFGIACVPLVWLLFTVVKNGLPTILHNFPAFLTYDMRNVIGDAQGGLYHAIIGTLLVTLAAAVISVPLGLFAAIYLVEYGKKNRIAKVITFLVDVMTGIPSIVAGLFALSLFTLIFGPGIRIGLGGSVALSLLMVPTVVRSAEEMLRLVPDDLREASYALGVPKWRTITKMVLPTALGGIVTGVVLAISRVIGETAPLLVVAGFADSVNFNLTDGRMMTLPVFIFTQYAASTPKGTDYAWGGALVLIVIVMLLNLIARIIGKIFAPPTSR